MAMFRCRNPKCQDKVHEDLGPGGFEHSDPAKAACPHCGTSITDKRFGSLIQRRVQIHFDPPSGIPGYGKGVRACDERIPIFAGQRMLRGGVPSPSHAGTGSPTSVTCIACKKTLAFKEALAALEAPGEMERDTPVEADEKPKIAPLTEVALGRLEGLRQNR